MQSTLLTNWLRYKRRSDNTTVEARLIKEEDGGKMMEIRETRVDDVSCPVCKTILTKRNGKDFPNFILETTVFHERHRALDIK